MRKPNFTSIALIAALLVCIGALITYSVLSAKNVETQEAPPAAVEYTPGNAVNNGHKVVLDVGHGGFDPGAYGAAGSRECDINLEVAKKVENALVSYGYDVVMTRKKDIALADTKEEDMAKRREIIETSGQDITISIHQNYFEDASARGPQVFYLKGSEEGARLAKCLQDALNAELEVASPRTEQDSDYYIVKSGEAPAVIVECGFISNPEEEQLLKNKSYRLRIAKAIVKGTEKFFSE